MKDDYLYFSSDVVDAVFKKFGEKYTKEEIWDVFDCSISYIHDLMRYTDTTAIYVRYLGYIHVNERQMKERKAWIEKSNKKSDSLNRELESINRRLEMLKSPEYNIRPIKSDMARSILGLRMGRTWDKVQDFQNKIIF